MTRRHFIGDRTYKGVTYTLQLEAVEDGVFKAHARLLPSGPEVSFVDEASDRALNQAEAEIKQIIERREASAVVRDRLPERKYRDVTYTIIVRTEATRVVTEVYFIRTNAVQRRPGPGTFFALFQGKTRERAIAQAERTFKAKIDEEHAGARGRKV
ncbi:MAG TPA: hypothetical protein VNU02_04550 [Candidatus Dormibacteraeota bacterium]|nr:hypothetical protein [Candidatus Dormibacteraeota bacterium]